MLAEKNIIVTGGARGLGEAIVRKCLSLGARVGLLYFRSKERAEKVREMHPEQVILLEADVRHQADISERFRHFVEIAGRLDGLVNNAGVAASRLLALSRDDTPLRSMIDTNLLGTILCCRAAMGTMWPQHCGSIVNIGSVAALRPSAGQAVYAATKGGIVAFTRALAVECGQVGVRVNCVSPGPVDTDMLEAAVGTDLERMIKRTPLRALVKSDDVAAAVAFLLGDSAASITGAHLTVDAGYEAGFP